ncbi:MAG TPA: hypothetical protein VN658_03445 [Candidatus Acidoferrales bacterium]|nr:hypothetical protein [Candidatus Acidoferrales bacterium]
MSVEKMNFPIFTLDARGNIMLEVTKSYFNLTETQVFREVNAAFSAMLGILKAKKIDYASLKNALVPCPDRNEAGFIFDTTQIKSGWYGLEVFKRILPALDPDATHSVLCGDLIGENNVQDRLYDAFSREVMLERSCTWRHSTQFFIVYINNLSDQMLANIRTALRQYKGYVGWVDCYAPSYLKNVFSMTLCNSFLKAKRFIIQGHEDDHENTEDINMVGYPFEKYVYTCKSLQSMYSDLFLSYKIERAVYPGFESDTLFSLNAVSSTVVPLTDCKVEVEEAKLHYLREKKTGSMKKSGLLPLAKEEVQTKIGERLAGNYIFNMTYLVEHETMKFNTILNFLPKHAQRVVKLTASLEYKPSEKCVRLITLF